MAEGIIAGVGKAASYLFMTGVAYIIWKIAYNQTNKSESSFMKLMITGFFICAIIAFLATINLGTHRENCDDDPIYGRCDRVQDYEPTAKEIASNFSYFIILLYVPIVLGIYKGSKE